MNDRTRIEVMLCCRLLYLLVIGGTQFKDDEVKKLANKVIQEPLENIELRKSQELQRRCLRIEKILIEPLSGKSHGSKVALIIYHFLNNLIDEDYITIPPGSNFEKLADTLFSLITDILPLESVDFEKVSKSAQKQAVLWRKKLRENGFF